MKRMKFAGGLVATALAMCIFSNNLLAEVYPVNWDAEAVEVLKQMDAYTDSMKKFVIKAESYTDATIGAGLVVSNPITSVVSVDRSGSLHSVSQSGSQTNEIYLNKGNLTVYTSEHKFFTHATVPEDLKKGLLFALEKFDVETPLFDLLVVGSLEYFVSTGEDIIYITGDSSIRGVDCHHILISGAHVDLQIWVEKGDKPTPKRTLMTYKDAQTLPRHEVFIDWKETDDFKSSVFKFKPPKGAREIDFIDAP
jgi:hypothetical protein